MMCAAHAKCCADCDERNMNLVVDIGNSRVKAAVTDGGRVVRMIAGERFDVGMMRALQSEFPDIERAVVSSTAGDAEAAAGVIRQVGVWCMMFTPQVPVPVANAYGSPGTLGADRLAAAVGIAAMYPGRNAAIIDCGTALTVDLLTADGTYRGGFISPGLRMRFAALHEHTSRLPECGPTEEILPLGTDTRSCIEQGVMQGMTAEIEAHIARFEAKNDDLLKIFTGGDAKFFVKRIKNAIFANCEPVICGLDRILEYNVSE